MKRLLISIAVLLIAASACSQAFATIQVGDDVQIGLWLNAPLGQSEGPFQVAIYDDPLHHFGDPLYQPPSSIYPGHVGTSSTVLAGPFLTFCVETHEYFSASGSRFDIKGFGTSTVETGRLLTGYSAWVYSQFVNNFTNNPSITLPATINGYSAGAAMNAYQNAVWSGMINSSDNSTNHPELLGKAINVYGYGSEYGFYTGHDYDLNDATLVALGISYNQFLTTPWGGVTTDPSNPDSGVVEHKLGYLGGIQVINIDAGFYSTGYRWGQDQLIPMLAFETGSVPEPASIAIWGLGVAVAAALCLRRRRSA